MDFSLCKTVTGVMRNQGWLLSSCLGKKNIFRYYYHLASSQISVKYDRFSSYQTQYPAIHSTSFTPDLFFFMFGEYFRISNNSFGRQKQNPSDVNLNLKEYSENITMNPVEKQSSQSMKVFFSQNVLSIVKTDSMSF